MLVNQSVTYVGELDPTEITENTERDTLTHNIIGAAIEVHRELGSGLLINFNVKILKDGIRRMII